MIWLIAGLVAGVLFMAFALCGAAAMGDRQLDALSGGYAGH